MKQSFQFTADPGHGWLKVPRQLLAELSIEFDISIFSYISGAIAYLEEDSDAGKFMAAMKEQCPHIEVDIIVTHINHESHIRQMRPYPLPRPQALEA